MKVSLIGVGNWGRNHLRVLYSMPNIELVWVCDLSEKLLEKAKSQYPNIKTTQDSDLAIRDADAVVIASSAVTHYELAKKALEAGKHVFVEKPMALNVKHAEELVNLATQKGLKLMVGHLLLYHPVVTKLKEMIDQGEIGDVLYLYSRRVNLGRIRSDENVMWSLAPHDISVANYLINEKPIIVRAKGKDYVQPGIQDMVFMDVEYESGKIAHFHVSWLDPHKVRTLVVVGTDKMVVFDDMNQDEKLKIYDKGVDWEALKQPHDIPPGTISVRYGDIYSPRINMSQQPLNIELNHFISSIVEDFKPLTDGQNGLEVLKVLSAGQQSLDNGGEPVKIQWED